MIQFTDKTKQQCFNWVGGNRRADFEEVGENMGMPILVIETLEGDMTARIGDWIIKGVKGEFYPCKPDIFETTYELVEESNV